MSRQFFTCDAPTYFERSDEREDPFYEPMAGRAAPRTLRESRTPSAPGQIKGDYHGNR